MEFSGKLYKILLKTEWNWAVEVLSDVNATNPVGYEESDHFAPTKHNKPTGRALSVG